MITLSLAPDGSIQAFAEPAHPGEAGYYLDLPEGDPVAFQRVLFQGLLRRAAATAKAQPQAQAPSLAQVVAWLEANPPQPKVQKAKLTLADLMGQTLAHLPKAKP